MQVVFIVGNFTIKIKLFIIQVCTIVLALGLILKRV